MVPYQNPSPLTPVANRNILEEKCVTWLIPTTLICLLFSNPSTKLTKISMLLNWPKFCWEIVWMEESSKTWFRNYIISNKDKVSSLVSVIQDYLEFRYPEQVIVETWLLKIWLLNSNLLIIYQLKNCNKLRLNYWTKFSKPLIELKTDWKNQPEMYKQK